MINKILRIKWELIILIGMIASVIVSYSMYVDGGDIRAKILMYISAIFMLLIIFGYKTIKHFRQYVAYLWQ